MKDLKKADLVYCYLMPRIMPKLKEKLGRDLKRGSRVISYAFPITEWKPQYVLKAKKQLPIYLYEKS